VQITDFTPRFKRFERVFNPPQIFRRIEPVAGLPRIKIQIRPTFNYGQPTASRAMGSNHIRYAGGIDTLRMTTDAPLSYIAHETPFALVKPVTLILGSDEPFEAAVETASREFLERTREYWLDWTRSLAVPLEYQADIIRAAVTLKLCSFEETGAIIAAHTTSIPEAPGTQRNWDYRYCWLRDAFFVIKALNRLGATQTMEDYIHYITNIAVDAERPLRPVYGIVPAEPLEERFAADLAGFQGMGPVRIGNQASEQPQHDAYGSVILGASQMFIDERLPRMGDAALFHRLEPLGAQARRLAFEPDAGPWEYRGRQRVHTHSATMCWVACDRLASIARRLGIADRAAHWRQQADHLRKEILARAWNERRGAITGALDHGELDDPLRQRSQRTMHTLKDLRGISGGQPEGCKQVSTANSKAATTHYVVEHVAQAQDALATFSQNGVGHDGVLCSATFPEQLAEGGT
jgi:GH15 family glucan-1,4-alpha-glucosidase